ncbi:MAG: ATP-binding protein [Caldimonas sp.]
MQTPARRHGPAALFGEQASPALREHELERNLERVVACGAVLLVWPFDLGGEAVARTHTPLLALVASYLVAALAYRYFLRDGRAPGAFAAAAFLVLDPVVLAAIVALDAGRFAFLHPLLFVVVVRSGLRYGLRTMAVSWAVALLASTLLLASDFWRERTQLTLAFVFMLALVPALFVSLVRRIHGVRTIEEERARLAARHDEVVARSAFLARVSHELRSPLQGIVSALDVLTLRSGPAVNAEDEMIQRIRRSSLLLNTHLRDLLTLAKGEAGHLDLRPEPFDACTLVDSVANSAMDLARDKKLELIVERPSAAVFVIADSARIDQILTNLVINSIRYTHSWQVRLTLHPYSAQQRVLGFVVSDTGPGIPESMLPTLLAPDRTISGSERRGEGSGIGLAIVRTLVDHLGGSVAVESRVGRGTTFTVDIPAEPVDDGAAAGAPDSPTGRLLVVDDNADIADALASVADELGFECDCAPSVAVAANALASRTYDAALVDIEMPGLGGAELAQETRRGGGPNALTRFIGMSAGEIGAEARAAFDACLRKPIDHASLRHALLGPGTGARPSQPGLWSEPG